ncbi:MAG TPA: type II toxin-antitoxin system HicB family antitoxin [Syntrophobacteraceae bacterium]|nr:type II toxin-antitoxin system HicB family antitoxin [Syntrophobacteraceae bacterium]
MKNIMEIDGHKALISFDPDIGMLRGEFLGLSGGADFYATDVQGLLNEGRKSLEVYLQACEERGIAPFKRYSGRFNVRISPDLHADIVTAAEASGMSLNQWVEKALSQCAND